MILFQVEEQLFEHYIAIMYLLCFQGFLVQLLIISTLHLKYKTF
jgi:hypothetical protein